MSKSKRGILAGRLLGLIILAAMTAPLIGAPNSHPQFVRLMRDKSSDIIQRMWPREYLNPSVTIVDVDEKSLTELGQWPWSRLVIADLVRKLDELGAKAIGFDVLFPEYDRLSPALIANSVPGLSREAREELLSLPNNEDALAAAMRDYGRVVVARTATEDKRSATYLSPPPPVGVENVDPRKFLNAFPFESIITNIPEIEDAAAGHGFINTLPSFDGVTRYVAMFSNVFASTDNRKLVMMPSFSAELLRVGYGGTKYKIVGEKSNFGGPSPGIKEIIMDTKPLFKIPTMADGSVRVHYTRQGLGRYVSAIDVLSGIVDPKKIKNKFVLIGTSSQGLKDIRETPISVNTPGVEVHANIIEMVIDQLEYHGVGNVGRTADMLYSLPGAFLYEIIVMLLAGLLMVWGVPRAGWALGLTVLLVSVGGLVMASSYLYLEKRIFFDVSVATSALSMLFIILIFSNYIRESGEKNQVRNAFGQYISPTLVERLAEKPEQLALGGESKHMTLLFADVRGFTNISESFGSDAEGLTQLINRLLTPLSNEILNTQGTIDKYMGDAIMAFWNAPLSDPQHCENACRAGIAMFAALDELNAEREKEAQAVGAACLPLKVGIGINSGPCVVGNMGSEQRFDYSVLGDPVNLASRLEGQSKTYGVHIVAGAETIQGLEVQTGVLPIDLIAVQGKTEAVEIFTVCAVDSDAIPTSFETLKSAHEDFMRYYRAQEWAQAITKMAECEAILGDVLAHNTAEPRRFQCPDLHKLYTLYRGRIAQYQAEPPEENWDYVFRAMSK